MKLELAKFIVEALINFSGDEYDHPQIEENYFYSHRVSPTTAVIMEHSLMVFTSALALACQHTDSDPSDERIELLQGIANLRTDSMGRDQVVLY